MLLTHCLVVIHERNEERRIFGNADDESAAAANLFYNLRKADELGAKVILARMPSQKGVGLAVVNRLLRAAGFEVVSL